MRKRNIQKNIRMTQDETDIIMKKANKANMTFSNYVISSGLKNEIVIIDGIKDFTHQLSKVGVNLNQLTILCHKGKVSCADLSSVNKMLKDIWDILIYIRRRR